MQNKLDEEEFDTRPFVKWILLHHLHLVKIILTFMIVNIDRRYKIWKYRGDTGDEQYTSFKFFQIKVVLFANSDDYNYAHRLKNLRAIALS